MPDIPHFVPGIASRTPNTVEAESLPAKQDGAIAPRFQKIVADVRDWLGQKAWLQKLCAYRQIAREKEQVEKIDEAEQIQILLNAELEEIQKRRNCAFENNYPEDWKIQPLKEPDATKEVSVAATEVPDATKRAKLVGLALSGGGIRSAMFNLGVLQAFSHRGLLRYVDYLSSVSGGGYIAAWFASHGHNPSTSSGSTESRCFHKSADAHLGIDPVTQAHCPKYKFARAGECLKDVIGFAWRYTAATLPIILLFLSGLGLFSALVAIFWRSFDQPDGYRYFSHTLGFNGLGHELLIAFLPCVITMLLWIVLGTVRLQMIKSRPLLERFCATGALGFLIYLTGPLVLASFTIFTPPTYTIDTYWVGWPTIIFDELRDFDKIARPIVTGIFAVSWITAIVLLVFGQLVMVYDACEAILGVCRKQPSKLRQATIDRLGFCLKWGKPLVLFSASISLAIFLGNGETHFQSAAVEMQLNHFFVWLTVATFILQAIAVFGRNKLIQSQNQYAAPWQLRFSAIVSWGILFVVCFWMVHWMGRENLSGYATYRDPALVREDIRSWDSFKRIYSEVLADVAIAEDGFDDKEVVDLAKRFNNLHEKQIINLHARPNWEASNATPVLSLLQTSKCWSLLFGYHWYHLTGKRYNELVDHRREYLQWTADADAFLQKLAQVPETPLTTHGKDQSSAANAKETKRLDEKCNWYEQPKLTALLLNQAIKRVKGTGNEGSSVLPALKKHFEERKPAMDRWTKKEFEDFESLMVRLVAPLASNFKNGNETGQLEEAAKSLPKWERASLNRMLLEILYPSTIRQRQMVTTMILPPADQAKRWQWAIFWLGIFLSCLIVVDFNADSPFHQFYRSRLKRFYVALSKPEFNDRLAELDTCSRGMPYHLVNGALLLHDDPGSTTHPFLMSPKYCGTPEAGYQLTADYNPELSVTDAITVSGAAVTPMMIRNLPLSLLMTVFNLRLGQWMARPRKEPRVGSGSSGKPWRIMRELIAAACRRNGNWQIGFVADGGFRDYYGIEELIRRRCSLMIVSDAGTNVGRDEFASLANIVRLGRVRYGVEFLDLDHDTPIDLGRFKRNENRVPQQWACLRVRYPSRVKVDEDSKTNIVPGDEALLVYIHMSLTGNEEIDLQQFRNYHPQFPGDRTSNQFFTSAQVESYRQLGHHIGSLVCEELPPHLDANPQWSGPNDLENANGRRIAKPLSFAELQARLVHAYVSACHKEKGFSTDDVAVHAVFDPPDLVHDWTFESFKFSGPLNRRPFAWLDRYDCDADFRLFIRHQIMWNAVRSSHWLVEETFDERLRVSTHADDVTAKEEAAAGTTLRSPAATNSEMDPEPKANLIGKAAVLLYARIEWLRSSLNKELSEEIFQIGGRRRLVQLLEQHLLPTLEENPGVQFDVLVSRIASAVFVSPAGLNIEHMQAAVEDALICALGDLVPIHVHSRRAALDPRRLRASAVSDSMHQS